MRTLSVVLALVLTTGLVACPQPDPTPSSQDAAGDAGLVDRATADAAVLDRALPDGAGTDLGGGDAARVDAATFDSSGSDAANHDSSSLDSQPPDAAIEDVVTTDATEVEAGSSDARVADSAVEDAGPPPVRLDGVYQLETRLELGAVLPGSISATLAHFDEMTDDSDLAGNLATGSYGLDPAAFFVDLAFRQSCCWEATGSAANWESCRAQDFQHPVGDLEQLYTEAFSSWDGAQAVAFGECSDLEFIHASLQQSTQIRIDAVTPSSAVAIARMQSDLSAAFAGLTLLSTLTLDNLHEGASGTFVHSFTGVVVDLHDLDGVLHSYEVSLSSAGLSDLSSSGAATLSGGLLTLSEHDVDLRFGRLLRTLYHDVLLPGLDCDPGHSGSSEPCASTQDLFATWVDCAALGSSWADQAVLGSLGAAVHGHHCSVGLVEGAAWLDGRFNAGIDTSTVLGLGGTAIAAALDGSGLAAQLVGGNWAVELTENSATKNAAGQFSGQR